MEKLVIVKEPISIKVDFQNLYRDRAKMSADIRFPEQRVMALNGTYFLESGKCECGIYSNLNGTCHQYKYSGKDRKCDLFEKGCIVFTDERIKHLIERDKAKSKP